MASLMDCLNCSKIASRTKRPWLIKGFTLVEVMMAVAILGIVTPIVAMMLAQALKSFTAYESAMQLRITNQATLNRIYLRLGSCKRIFNNSTADSSFVTSLNNLSGAPAQLTGSVLPIIQTTGSLAFGTSDFVSADAGNCLFFINNDSMPTMLSGTSTVKIDVYRFNYYYLTSVNPKPIRAAPTYNVVEWQSVQFADYDQIMSVSTTGNRQQNAMAALYAMGVKYVFDSNNGSASTAFYQFNSAGVISSANNFSIPMYRYTVLTKMITGIIIGGYNYGVASNSSLWTTQACPKTIPEYAVASNPFPGGFEVAITGQSSGRTVLVRSVLVAQGSMPGIVADDLQIVSMARDVW